MRLLYSALYYCLLPALVLRMLWRSRRAPAYRERLAERFGLFPARQDLAAPAIWVHAVSVGETQAAAPLVEALLRAYPDHRLVLTTTTPTGSQRVRALFGERVFHVYAPWDLPGAVRRFLRRTRPRLLVIMETELWPNMVHYSRASGCHIILANARLSEHSARGYARLGPLVPQLLRQLDAVACQTDSDGKRFLTLGLTAAALHVTGSLKFELVVGDDLRARAAGLREALGGEHRPIVVAASTHSGEEALVLAAYREVRQRLGDCLLVLVPRHPERFDQVHSLCLEQGWRVQCRSAGVDFAPGADIVLGDTMGELMLLLGTATLAVFGGSLLARGGHNVLEAAAWGVPVITGPHVQNFEEICGMLASAGALVRLESPDALASSLLELLDDPGRRRQMGAAGRQVVAENRGACARQLALVEQQLTVA